MRKVFVTLCIVLVVISIFLPAAKLYADSGQTLDSVVELVKKMVAQGKSRDEIARTVTEIVDKRVVNVNSWERLTEWRNIFDFVPGIDNPKEDEFSKFRARGMPEYTETAKWVWDSQYGQCEECANLAYYILKKAGVKENVRILSTSAGASGHAFVVWGLKDGADPTNPKTWGNNARVVDGWAGTTLTGDEAYKSGSYSSGGKEKITDQTKAYDKTAAVWKVDPSPDIIDALLSKCFIATAAYGTPTAREIDILRQFRDQVMMTNTFGNDLVHFYYEISPPLAEFIAEHETLRTIVREFILDPVVEIVRITRCFWTGVSYTGN